MEKYTFKIKDEEEEFFLTEVSDEMKDFLIECEDEILSAETEEYKIYCLTCILEALRVNASFERSVSDGTMDKYGSLRHLFLEYEEICGKTRCEFMGVKKQVTNTTNVINDMGTIFRVGMTVYDYVFFGKTPLKVTEVKEDETLRVLCGEVIYCYTGDGRFIGEYIPSNRNRCLSQTSTLSTSPYTLQGFEQKAPTPTYEEALKEAHRKDEYYYLPNDLEAPSKELADAAVALLKLLFLRDYYNEGWQPNWQDNEFKHFIKHYRGTLGVDWDSGYSRVLNFKSEKIRDKFLEEQRELLEIAKPLL